MFIILRNLSLAALIAVFGAHAAQVNYVLTTPEVLMPDGTVFRIWSDATNYSKTYHVNQGHPRASDENPGTEDLPFRTINRAAQVAGPGERVWIHAGVYREMVEPRRPGEAADRMIAYEAAPGEQAIIRGSSVIETRWERSRDPQGKRVFSKRLWMTTLPDDFFPAGYNAFATPNASNEEIDLMPWALAWKGRIPYTLPRGLLFQDGRRMSQLATYEDLVRLPGSYWVAPDGKTVHIRPFGDADPNGGLFEAAVQSHLFKPKEFGFGFIRVSGLIMEHCANGFPRVGVGALFTMGGHHWIIEGNTIRQVNSVGIEMGYRTFESADKRHPRRQDPNLGHAIVRGNTIYDCGTAGIRSHEVSWGLVEGNKITDCGWQDAEFYWETAGIKLLVTRGTLVRNNHIARIEAGGGIWLDWDNRGSRVTGNVIHDVSTVQGAVFVEASQQPNLVDHNVFWNIQGQGVRAADTDNLVIAHNLFGRIAEDLVVAKVATTRSLGGRRLTSRNNRLVNNIIVDSAKPPAMEEGNTAESNATLRGGVEFDPDKLLLTWKSREPLPAGPVLKGCERDFFGRLREGAEAVPGPFVALPHASILRLTAGRRP
jgi:alpha-N-arabinofuranosidase